jgi:hypothetical protein
MYDTRLSTRLVGGTTDTIVSNTDLHITSINSCIYKISMATQGLTTYLPDATSLRTDTTYTFHAYGSAYTIRDYAGNPLTTVTQTAPVSLQLISNSTTAGVWMGASDVGINDAISQSPPTLLFSGCSTTKFKIVSLSSTKTVCIYENSSDALIYASIVNIGASITSTTSVPISQTPVAVCDITVMSASKLLFAYTINTVAYALVLTISNDVVSVGPAYAIFDVGNVGYIGVSCSATTLSTSRCIVALKYYSAADTNAVSYTTLVDVNNSDVSVSGSLWLPANAIYDTLKVVATSSSQAICAYRDNNTYIAVASLSAIGNKIYRTSNTYYSLPITQISNISVVSPSKVIISLTYYARYDYVLEVDVYGPSVMIGPLSSVMSTGTASTCAYLNSNKVIAVSGTRTPNYYGYAGSNFVYEMLVGNAAMLTNNYTQSLLPIYGSSMATLDNQLIWIFNYDGSIYASLVRTGA